MPIGNAYSDGHKRSPGVGRLRQGNVRHFTEYLTSGSLRPDVRRQRKITLPLSPCMQHKSRTATHSFTMAGDDPSTTPNFDIMEIQDDVEQILRKCDIAILVPIATTLKAEQTTYADADKRLTLRGIQTVLFDEVVDTTQKLAMFTSLKDVIPGELVVELEQTLQKVYMSKPVSNTNSNTLQNNMVRGSRRGTR